MEYRINAFVEILWRNYGLNFLKSMRIDALSSLLGTVFIRHVEVNAFFIP
jgi:hypothetical protein